MVHQNGMQRRMLPFGEGLNHALSACNIQSTGLYEVSNVESPCTIAETFIKTRQSKMM